MKKTTTERIPTPEEVQKFEAECLEIEAYLKRKADAKAATINSTPTAEGIRAGMIGDKCNIQTDSEALVASGPFEALLRNLNRVTKIVFEEMWVSLPFYVTIVDDPGSTIRLRLDKPGEAYTLLASLPDQPLQFPVDMFIAEKLYPDLLISGDHYVAMHANMQEVGDGMVAIGIQTLPMLINEENGRELRKSCETLG